MKNSVGEESEVLFRLHNIRKTFRNKRGLLFEFMEIRPRRLTFLVGDSGIGKSTLLHILGLVDRAEVQDKTSSLFFYPPSEQRQDYFELYRHDFLRGRCASLRRRHFGFLPQHGHLIHTLSVKQNLDIVRRLRGVNSNGLHAIQQVLTLVKLGDKKYLQRGGDSPANLSGGESQRLALARAVLGMPRVLFVDEPTTYMNLELVQEAMRILATQVTQYGSSVIVVTHQQQELQAMLQVIDVPVDVFTLQRVGERHDLTTDDNGIIQIAIQEL